jgi:hypothetical protein
MNKMMCLITLAVRAFTAYEWVNQSNVMESCLLLEPDAWPVSDGNEESETTVQMKQDRTTPAFKC